MRHAQLVYDFRQMFSGAADKLNTPQIKSILRMLLFVYSVLIVCPIGYWPFAADMDNTWYFALNYAAAHHMTPGRDIIWTTGPLSYLTVPQAIGNNLAEGLAFQIAVWVVAMLVLADVFFRSRYTLRRIAFFSIFLGLSGRLYQYPSPLGLGDLLFAAALILLVQFQLHAGMGRLIAAFVMLGLLPQIKFVGLFMTACVVVCFIVDRLLHRRPGMYREILLAVIVPFSVAAVGYRMTIGPFQDIATYLRGSLELSRGYSLGVSLAGPPAELVAALETFLLVAIALVVLATRDRRMAAFIGLLLAGPVFVSIKHAFVRQDAHILHFFCFMALALALIALVLPLTDRRELIGLAIILLALATVWQDNVARTRFKTAVASITGVRTVVTIWRMLPPGHLRQLLDAESRNEFPAEIRVEPEIRAVIGASPVASLSVAYSNATMDGLNLVMYPVIQRYAAYTPYLDRRNADWVRDQGPRYMIFDAQAIDGRHPWTETPAMWAEIYRWYDMRMTGSRNLLLERRSLPRFNRFETLRSVRAYSWESLTMPESEQPIFWTMNCSLTRIGRLSALLFRVPEVTMKVETAKGDAHVFRVPVEVLGAPSAGNHLPADLKEFAEVFSAKGSPEFSIRKISFGGDGMWAYAAKCNVEYMRPVL